MQTTTVYAGDERIDHSPELGFTPSKLETITTRYNGGELELPPVRIEVQRGRLLVVDGRHRIEWLRRNRGDRATVDAIVLASDGTVDLGLD